MLARDPLGCALKDYVEGRCEEDITVECSVTEPDILPVEYLFRGVESMPALEQKALQCCTGHVLDVGAAAGSHALALQAMGLECTALDISQGAVEVMQTRGVKNVVCDDFYRFHKQGFDTVLFLMNGLGIAGTLDGLVMFLSHAAQLMSEGGQILADSSDILYLFEEEDGSVLIDLNDSYYGELEYSMRYGAVEGAPFSWLFVDFHTLSQAAATVGLDAELIMEDDHFQYLARLTRKRD